jgi:hypothetical protein
LINHLMMMLRFLPRKWSYKLRTRKNRRWKLMKVTRILNRLKWAMISNHSNTELGVRK